MTHKHRARRKAWRKQVLQAARSRGDKRPDDVILKEQMKRSEIIRQAFKDSYHDKEQAETVALNNYPDVGIFKAEVLTQARSYVHPKLLPT
jgi:hypothetical protein